MGGGVRAARVERKEGELSGGRRKERDITPG